MKTIKRALDVTIGDQVFTFSEFQTIMYEAAELANERPIGRMPTEPDDGTYLAPNDLILGRSSTRVPQGLFQDRTSCNDRFNFIQTVMKNYWKRWMREVFPRLVIQPKWHTDHRNVCIGDVVLIQDSNVVRGEWKMGIVVEVTPSKDGRVRRVEVTYNRGPTSITVSRAVQRLIVLVPCNNSDTSETPRKTGTVNILQGFVNNSVVSDPEHDDHSSKDSKPNIVARKTVAVNSVIFDPEIDEQSTEDSKEPTRSIKITNQSNSNTFLRSGSVSASVIKSHFFLESIYPNEPEPEAEIRSRNQKLNQESPYPQS